MSMEMQVAMCNFTFFSCFIFGTVFYFLRKEHEAFRLLCIKCFQISIAFGGIGLVLRTLL